MGAHKRQKKPFMNVIINLIFDRFFSDAKNYEAGNANQAGVLVAPAQQGTRYPGGTPDPGYRSAEWRLEKRSSADAVL